MAGGRGTRVQHHAYARPYRRKIWTQAARDSNWVQVHCRPNDGRRNPDRGRRVGWYWIFAILARTRWRVELPPAGQCDGGGRQTAGPVGWGFAARVWRD